jgi:hypothetical protein
VAVAPVAHDVTVQFNPQPDPPALIFQFTATGEIDGPWSGRLGDPGAEPAGRLRVELLASDRQGSTLNVLQRWTLYPPDPFLPVTVLMGGIVNLSTGALVLNAPDGDRPVAHVRGQALEGPGGISIGGELMFNPQPDPPATLVGFSGAGGTPGR